MVFKKIIFQNRYVALETPPPFMANTILNFHFDYPQPSITPIRIIWYLFNIFIYLIFSDILHQLSSEKVD